MLKLKPREYFIIIIVFGVCHKCPCAQLDQVGRQDHNPDESLMTRGKLLGIHAEERRWFDWLNPLEYIKDYIMRTRLAPTRKLAPDGVCYGKYGCFNRRENMSLAEGGPQSPEDVNITFYFFSNSSSEDIDDLLNENKTTVKPEKTWTLDNWTLRAMPEGLDTNKPFLVVTHGLTGSKRTPWMMPLVVALLENLNCTVLVMDWENGANGSYTDAGVNTPMAGVTLSLFLQKVIADTECTIGPDNITLVGFSMGGQVMGFAGRHFRNATKMLLWRITGLDPAGYLFENTNWTLSKYDASYVDVIHTQGGNIFDFKIGLQQSVGHVDFFPNGGSVQAGCPSKAVPLTTTFWDDFTCSHYRAPRLFIESLNTSGCTFYSYHCKDWKEFESGDCVKKANSSDIGIMGYSSYKASGRGDQFLYTNSKPPYCRGNNTLPPTPPNTTKSS